jgi:hypothetical protein
MLAGKHHGKIKAMHDEEVILLLLRVLRLGISGLDGAQRVISSIF